MTKLKVSILAPLAFFIVVIVAGFSVGVYFWQESRDAELLDKIDADLEGIFARLVVDEVGMMEATLEAITLNEELKGHFLARDREKLLAASLPLFQVLRDKYKITHFYFTAPDRVNFLRVHQPARFGDTINRATTLQTERKQDASSGLELGPLGTFTLRVVVPWKMDGHLIGYLELGSEIDHVISGASDFLGMKLHVFVPKTNLERDNWESGMAMLGLRKDWDQLEQYVVAEPTAIPEFLVDHVNNGGLERGGIIKDVPWGGRIVSLLHKPITNASGEKTEVLIALHDETIRDQKRSKFILLTILGSTIIGSALFILIWVILDKLEQNMRDYEENLIQAKDEAETSNMAKTQFLATMSHELRTPLNAILGFSEIMKLQAFGPLGSSKYIEYASDIHFSGSHLLALINDILHISKIESGGHLLHIERFDVAECIDDCLTIVKDRALSVEVSLVNNIAGDLPRLFADRRAIHQCLLNLLSNAIKFTPDKGTVTLSARVSNQWFDLTVTDTGIGIADEDLPKLTHPFTQIERMQTARIHEGTGLGLTITRNLVEMHGGTLHIDSELGGGTAVTMRLPRGEVGNDVGPDVGPDLGNDADTPDAPVSS